MKLSFYFLKSWFLLRVFVVSIKLMQVCLALGITDGGDLNLQPIGRLKERVISKRRARWPRAWQGGSSARLMGAPPSHSAADVKYSEVEDVKACLPF